MNKATIAKLIKNAQRAMSKHSPEILTGIGIAGMITTTVLAVKATPKATKLIEEKREELHLEPDEKLAVVETVKTTWKCYVPAVITGATSIACIIGASSVNARRNAALATAYNLSATALSEYKEKVVETIGEKKEKIIRDKIAEDHVKQNPVNQSPIIFTGKGTTRCMDMVTKQRFVSDIEEMRKIVNDLNERMLRDDYVSLSDFYYEVGLDTTSVSDDLGWNIGTTGLIKLDFDATIDTDGVPCIVVDYTVAPIRGFDRYN